MLFSYCFCLKLVNSTGIWWALWILRAWCFSTRASVARVLNTHPCVSGCLWENVLINFGCKLQLQGSMNCVNWQYNLHHPQALNVPTAFYLGTRRQTHIRTYHMGGGGWWVLTIFWVTGRLGPFDPPFSTYVEFWPLLLGSDVEYWPPFFQAL